MKKKYLFLFIVFIGFYLHAEESRILPLGDIEYTCAEEIFINEAWVPPFEEKPVITDDLINYLKKLSEKTKREETQKEIDTLINRLRMPFAFISPILETGLHLDFNSETGREHYIPTYDETPTLDKNILDFRPMYEINEIPSILTLGLLVQYAGFSLCFQPEVRASNSQLLGDYHITNFPEGFEYLDTNVPKKGITAYYNPPFEARIGRDKLSLGPGFNSTLALNPYMPYYDYAKFRFFYSWFSLSLYVISLNPTITEAESDYLDEYVTSGTNPESGATVNGRIYTERSKHLVISSATLTPLTWLLIRISQLNLVGGRDLEIYDFNPLLIFHSNYQEGTYSVPVALSATITPYRGLKLYVDYFLYDASLGDEVGLTTNPGAAACQGGFTVLSTPFFSLGPGRFRLDGEVSYVDPWAYGKFYDLRKFTSRIIYVESLVGRFWVDYPLGFYLGPDTIEANLRLSYGIPGTWDVSFFWNMNGMGNIDLYGWGEDNDYTHAIDNPDAVAPTSPVQWTNNFKLSGCWTIIRNIKLSAWYNIKSVQNRYNVPGDNFVFHYTGIDAEWKIY